MVTSAHLAIVAILGMVLGVVSTIAGPPTDTGMMIIEIFLGIFGVCVGVAWLTMMTIVISGYGKTRIADALATQLKFYEMFLSDLGRPFSWRRRK